jgi:hypothetical protein
VPPLILHLTRARKRRNARRFPPVNSGQS